MIISGKECVLPEICSFLMDHSENIAPVRREGSRASYSLTGSDMLLLELQRDAETGDIQHNTDGFWFSNPQICLLMDQLFKYKYRS